VCWTAGASETCSRQTDGQVDRQTYGETGRQTYRQVDTDGLRVRFAR